MKTKELEQELGLTKHTIRYYEKEGFIKPKKGENGYRIYSSEDVQTLQLVKFLRNLNISIDDVKGILKGEITFEEGLKVSDANLEHQIEGLKEIHVKVKSFQNQNLPIIPALENIEKKVDPTWFGINKTTDTISLGRKLTKKWARRQMIYGLAISIFLSYPISIGMNVMINTDVLLAKIAIAVMVIIVLFLLIIGLSFRSTSMSGAMLDQSLNQSVEFLRDGIRFYQFKGLKNNLRYLIAVLMGKDESLMKYYQYEDIEKVTLHTNRKYMRIMSPIAYDIFVVDFEFFFNDGQVFYFFWPMVLDDDARYIAYIIEDKVKNIEDKYDVLYAMKNGINITDYMMNKK